MKFYNNGVSPSLTMGLMTLMFLQLSRGPILVTVNVLPDFHPNEYLFENHKKGDDAESNENTRWKSYAEALRDIMIDAGQFDQEPYTVRDKLMYERYMAEFDKEVVMDSEFKLSQVEKGSGESELKNISKDDNFKR